MNRTNNWYKNPNRQESDVTDGGDTSINVLDGNVGTDVISPGEGGSDDESDEPTVLPSNHPLRGKLLVYQQYLESKQKQEEGKKRKEKRNKKTRQKNKEKSCKSTSYHKEQDWKIAI
jgi:hypothetical protein